MVVLACERVAPPDTLIASDFPGGYHSMSKSLRLLAALICAAAVGACAQPARVSQMTVGNIAGGAVAEDPAMLGALAIEQVTGGEKTDPLWTSEVGNPEFRAALENSLRANGLLSSDPTAAPYRLTAALEKVDQPVMGFDLRVTSTVNYRVTAPDGVIFFEKRVTHAFTAGVGDAFSAAERLRLANEGAIAGNIKLFIQSFVAHWNTQKQQPTS